MSIESIQLEWEDSNGEAQSYQGELEDLPITIGRSQSNTILLTAQNVSRSHATLNIVDNKVILTDVSSTKTLVNDQPIDKIALQHDDKIEIGPFIIKVNLNATRPVDKASTSHEMWDQEATVAENLFDADTTIKEFPFLDGAPAPPSFPPAAFKQGMISIEEINNSNLPVEEIIYLAIGGGLGSFIWADYLRCSGVPAEHIVSIGFENKPYNNYQRLCNNSQIRSFNRLRSNSDSTPDNIWGWPGYAVREIWQVFRQGDLTEGINLGWQIFTEPVFAESYTPRSGQVFDSIDKEMTRINWDKLC